MEYNQIIQGDSLTVLKTLPSESVNCCVTSPPYWGLRDYGIKPIIWDGVEGCEHEWITETTSRPNSSGGLDTGKDMKGQHFTDYHNRITQSNFCTKCNAWRGSLGLEPTFELYIKHLCDIFDEIKRVLRKDGTCWVNLGDTYWGGGNNRGSTEDNLSAKQFSNRGARGQVQNQWTKDYPAKSLCLIPQRFAIEMVNRGWILRNTIIWHKPNCMPSSAKDRFTVDLEYVFFFVKSKKYWFEQVFENYTEPLNRWGGDNLKANGISSWDNGTGQDTYRDRNMRPNNQGRNKRAVWTIKQDDPIYILEQLAEKLKIYKEKNNVDLWWLEEEICKLAEDYENKGTTWKISTKPFKEAHFATFPEDLIEPMIQAGCPRYVCKKCGKAREKILEPSEEYEKCLSYNPRVPIRGDASEYLKNARIKKGLSIKEIAKNFPSRTGGITGCVWNWENGKTLPTIPEWKILKQILELDNTYDFIMDLKIIHGENSCNWNGDLIKGQQKSGTSRTADYRFKGYTDCGCNAGFEGGVVLDPFIGSGTTAKVAKKQGKNYLGIELKQEYIDMANKRISKIPELLF